MPLPVIDYFTSSQHRTDIGGNKVPLQIFRARLSALSARVIAFYVGAAERNTIEYWQRYIFCLIALAGTVAGTLCILPATLWLASTGRPLGMLLLIPYAVNVSAVLSPALGVKAKSVVIAANFYLIAVGSLVLAGPEGESGIWFSVSVLILSLFAGFRPSLLMACLNLATGMVFAVMHARGLISWSVLKDFKFFSWVVQETNIFLMDVTFAFANAALIRGVGESFDSLRAAEAKARGFLVEKETLIREIYHRSKNNMQVVSSLLMLSSTELREESSKAIFKDVVNKIGSMSLVHQKLYESQDLSSIGMHEYVGELASLLMASYGIPPGKIALGLDIENISMLIDTAIPCGLVISEIVTNSLKYAFPGDRIGRIDIAMKRSEDDLVDLRISDDGVGVPEGFELSSDKRMGMNTVFTIVTHQMQGEIEFSSRSGVEYHIRFRRKLYEERVKFDGK
jgi:two-component sensor histidine kinase